MTAPLNEIEKIALDLVKSDWDLPNTAESISEAEVVILLSQAISQLLDRDFERLLQICYRIDLGEEKLRRILHESEPDQISMDLANALWERQKQKAEIRKRYS
ncbi:hypothetical protein [Algoriphagus hitonicola]|uniref:Uncharacterized protein n=1 Tax=Algoriphagus hitonicola TaxID=435880 RepID=A0A1I2W279_9BACT|nr:hypothetical protein [Algoriphagus hitonicola]SFG95504.1 hypothetical protein SAMN04487988_111107 [Algoriphagus hitonicola]